ncbi:MAG TPA: hypothetical protein PLU24_02215 [Candidatus Omnitrophota bacterium]|nr:hypothetical protein [Candidatus Omnitrophota bacterium]
MKKEVSDHLAKVFLQVTPRKSKEKERSLLGYIFLSAAIILVFILAVAVITKNRQGLDSSEILRLERPDGPRVLKFDFTKDRSSLASLFIALPDANLNRYKKIGFNIRIIEPQTPARAALKVSIVSRRKEISSLYLRQINNHWK